MLFPVGGTSIKLPTIGWVKTYERTYDCGSCGHSMDRDLNAAINLSRLAFIVKAYQGITAPMLPMK